MDHCKRCVSSVSVNRRARRFLIASRGRCFISSITSVDVRLDCEMFALIIIGMEGNSLWFCSARLGDVPKRVAMQIALANAQRGAIRPGSFTTSHLTADS